MEKGSVFSEGKVRKEKVQKQSKVPSLYCPEVNLRKVSPG